MTPQRPLHHLLWRAGFGPGLTEAPPEPAAWLRQQQSAPFAPLAAVNLEAARAYARRQAKEAKQAGDEAAFKAFQEQQKSERAALNVAWVQQMATGPAPLREKMALFWHDHFGCRSNSTALTQIHLNALRQHALGSFRTLLLAVAQDPAMLQFLNGQQNRKAAPNENFARELLELYTLGRGHYTEADIKAAARAFTGWGFTLEGQFVNRTWMHDTGEKTVLGKTGNLDGAAVIAHVLDQRRCAQYLTEKIAAAFVAPDLPPEVLDGWSRFYYESDYDTGALLGRMFTSDAFTDARVIGTHIKSPVELLVGLMRQLELRFEGNEPILFTQKVLGQVLGYPPSVAGWPTGRQWIDASSLLIRLKLSENFIRAAAFDVAMKDDGDDGERTAAMMRLATPEQRMALRQLRQVRATANLEALDRRAGSGSPEQQLDALASFFLQTELKPEVRRLLLGQLTRPNPMGERSSTRLALGLLSLPDYQLA